MYYFIEWDKVKALRDGENTAQAVRLFKNPDNPVPVVPEAEIPELIRTFLIALSVEKQKPPAGLGTEDDAQKTAQALNQYLSKAVKELGPYNPKGVDANVGVQLAVMPEPHTVSHEPTYAVHGNNVILYRPNSGAVGNAGHMKAYRFLLFTFVDENKNIREIIEELATPHSQTRKTVEHYGLDQKEIEKTVKTYREDQENGKLPGEPGFRQKQILFPSQDDDHALSPFPNYALAREIAARINQRMWNPVRDNNGNAVYWENFRTRRITIGGTYPRNAGVLAHSVQALPCFLATPPRIDLKRDNDLVRDVETYQTLFPTWLKRHIYRTGAIDELHKAKDMKENNSGTPSQIKRKMSSALFLVSRDMTVLANRMQFAEESQLTEIYSLLPTDERAIFAHYFRELDASDEDKEMTQSKAMNSVAEKMLSILQNESKKTGKMMMEKEIAQKFRDECKKVLGQL